MNTELHTFNEDSSNMNTGIRALTQTRPAYIDFKEKCSRDREWIKYAYLQGTQLPQNRPHSDTHISDRTMRSKQQIEPKTDGGLTIKKLPLNKESSDTFTAVSFIKKPPAVSSPTKSSNKALKQLQTSEVKAAESKHKSAESMEANVRAKSVNEIAKLLSQKKLCEIRMQSHSSKAARNTDDKGALAKLRIEAAASQEEETKASAVSSKSSAAIIVTETGSTKMTTVKDLSRNSKDFQVEQKEFPNRMHHEHENMSGEQKSFTECHRRRACSSTERRLTRRDKALTKQISLQGTPNKAGKEAVTLHHHHSAQCRKDRSKLVLPSKIDRTSNTSEMALTPSVASVNPRDVVQSKSSDTGEGLVEVKSTNERIKIWREQGASQTSKVELTQRKAHKRPVLEMVELKHPHKSLHMNCDNKGEVKLHSGNTAQILKDKTTNCGMERPVKSKEHLPAYYMKDASKVEAVEAVIPCSTKTDKNLPGHLQHKSDKREPNFALTLDCKPATTMSSKHALQRETITQQLLKPTLKHNTAKVADPQSATENVATRKENKVTLRQHTFKGSSTDTFEEGSEKPKWNWKINCEQGVHQISKDKSDDSAYADTCGDQDIHLDEESEPEIPERGYLEDIDFVVSEFDLILRSNPELPARAYLEDIDFVSKEFELFFRRKSRHQEEQKISARNNNASETLELAPEANGSQLLNSDKTTEYQNDDYACLSQLSVCNTNPCDHFHEPLSSSQRSNPDVANHPLLKAPRTLPSHCMASDLSESQYQPLISTTRSQDSSSTYDLVAFRAFRYSRSPLQNAVKSQKEDQDIDDVSASNATELDEDYYQPLLFDSEKDPEEDYCTPFTQPILLSAENNDVDKPYIMGKQPPRSLQFLSTCTSPELHGKTPPRSLKADKNLPGQAVHQLLATAAMVSRKHQFEGHETPNFSGYPAYK